MAEGVRMSLHIVLFQPEIPQNTGNIARTCAAVGATLHLVHPLGYSLSDRYLKRAGMDYWHLVKVKEYQNNKDFFDQHQEDNLFFFTKKARICYCEVTYPEETYLIFGRESVGLDESLIRMKKESCIRIPMIEQARSLNLSNSAAIAAYEYLRQHDFALLQRYDHTFDWGA